MLRLLAQMLAASHQWKGCGAMAMLCDGHVTNHRQCGLDLHCAPLAAKVGYTVAVWLRLDQPLPPQGASVVCSVELGGTDHCQSDPLVLTLLPDQKASGRRLHAQLVGGGSGGVALGTVELAQRRWHLLALTHAKNRFSQVTGPRTAPTPSSCG